MKQVAVSVECLYEQDSLDTDLVVEKSADGDSEWYDLKDYFGNLLCMDGEVCEIEEVTDDVVTLTNRNGEFDVRFCLSHKDFKLATGEKINEL